MQAALNRKGFRCTFLPTFRFEYCSDDPGAREEMRHLAQYDWVVFSSATGVAATGELLKAADIPVRLLTPLRIAAVGRSSAAEIEATLKGLQAAFVGTSLQQVLDEIRHRETGEVRILNPTSRQSIENVHPRIPEGLHLRRIAVYQTVPNKELARSKLEAIRKSKFEGLFFTSPTSFDYFVMLMGTTLLERDIPVAAIGPTTAAHMRKKGISVSIVPEKPEPESIAQAFANFFAAEKSVNIESGET